jgi:hypothetical protein
MNDVSEMDRLAADFAREAQLNRRVRGVFGVLADRTAAKARELARSNGWSAETVESIVARTGSTSVAPEAYALGNSRAVYFQEIGTSRHAANPVLSPAADAVIHDSGGMLARAVGNL